MRALEQPESLYLAVSIFSERESHVEASLRDSVTAHDHPTPDRKQYVCPSEATANLNVRNAPWKFIDALIASWNDRQRYSGPV